MLLATLLSTIYLLTNPANVGQSIEVVHQYHLETVEGRTTFLIDKLTPYTARAGRLNQEIEILSQAVQILSPKEDQQTILVLSEKVTQKMAKLSQMLPVLNSALSINEDLLQLDAILQQTTPLSLSQQEIVNRMATLCHLVNSDRFMD